MACSGLPDGSAAHRRTRLTAPICRECSRNLLIFGRFREQYQLKDPRLVLTLDALFMPD
jgi:hypothetical protein